MDVFDKRKEMVQLMLDAHVHYGEQFEKKFGAFMAKNFPLEVHITSHEDNKYAGLRITKKPDLVEAS